MAENQERIAVLETQVKNLEEKIDVLFVEINKMHDCLDKTRDDLTATLKEMRSESIEQHKKMAARLDEVDQVKTKWTYLVLGAIAAAGWLLHNPVFIKIFTGE